MDSITRSFPIRLWFVNIHRNANVKPDRIDIPFFPVCLLLSVIHLFNIPFDSLHLYAWIFNAISFILIYSFIIVIYLLLALAYQDRALPFQWCQDIPWKGYQIYSFRFPGT